MQAPCREPDAALDPRTPGSCPGPKADAQPLSHPGVPNSRILSFMLSTLIVSSLCISLYILNLDIITSEITISSRGIKNFCAPKAQGDKILPLVILSVN